MITGFEKDVEPLALCGAAKQVAAGVASAVVPLTATCVRVSLCAKGAALRYVIGPGTPTANNTTSHYLPEGAIRDWRVAPGSSIAAIRDVAATADGVLEISEMV